MKYEEMTFQQKRRFKGCKCPLCGGAINRYEDVQIVQVRDGRYMHNFYIHSSCLLSTLLSSQLDTVSKEEGLYETQEI